MNAPPVPPSLPPLQPPSQQRRALALALAGSALPLRQAWAQLASPHAIDIPRWFTESFLDFKDEAAEAARSGKRLMLYFGQDGCPYCKALMQANFGHTDLGREITGKTQRHFVAIALNLWGDRETTWLDGRRASEKALARALQVQFTPTLLFLETDGRIVLRLNGYQPPERFTHILDWVIGRREQHESLAEYLAAREGALAGPPPRPQPYLLRDPAQLTRRPGGKPLAVLFEAPGCKACAELHAEAFARPSLRALLARFDIARLLPGRPAALRTPDGRTMPAAAFAAAQQVTMFPTVVFFDDRGREVFRFDGYMRPFHVESAFDYVASGAYGSEPQFQRFLQARAERLREAGRPVDLWR